MWLYDLIRMRTYSIQHCFLDRRDAICFSDVRKRYCARSKVSLSRTLPQLFLVTGQKMTLLVQIWYPLMLRLRCNTVLSAWLRCIHRYWVYIDIKLTGKGYNNLLSFSKNITIFKAFYYIDASWKLVKRNLKFEIFDGNIFGWRKWNSYTK